MSILAIPFSNQLLMIAGFQVRLLQSDIVQLSQMKRLKMQRRAVRSMRHRSGINSVVSLMQLFFCSKKSLKSKPTAEL